MKKSDYLVKPNRNFQLKEFPTKVVDSNDSNEVLDEKLKNVIAEISKNQNKLYAENRQSLLIILQGLDSSGKDGTIKQIMKGVNPQGVIIQSFKHPSLLEMEHDFLWRVSLKLPEHGQIAVFNRSHYENVLISKVHPELIIGERLPEIETIKDVNSKFWKNRYKQINNFENNIVLNGTKILKFYLHISKNEQRKRFLDRIENKEKHWKFSSEDIRERSFWNQYHKAYEKAFKHTSTKNAPWFIIPADDKKYSHYLIASIILEKMQEMKLYFPPATRNEIKMLRLAKIALEKEN
jgi:PPK2 family polyphosphate:nucleotide phosphotransferase